MRPAGRHRPERLAGVVGSPADRAGWDRLAAYGGSPFLTTAWLAPWAASVRRPVVSLLLRDPAGGLRAGACLHRLPAGISAAADVHSGDWDVVAADDEARGAIWRAVAEAGRSRVRLSGLAETPEVAGAARRALVEAGYGLVERDRVDSPRLALPGSFDELLAAASRNLRSQFGRRRRALHRLGPWRLRTSAPHDLERDLAAFLRLESAGWKGRDGTAIATDPRLQRRYRDFAGRASAAGWLRLRLLETDDRLLAADLSATFAGTTSLLKTTYDEELAELSPGLVLRGEALRAAIEEGSTVYDFLGGPDAYKLRWGATVRPRATVDAYRGPWRPALVYFRTVRPRLKAVRHSLPPATTAPSGDGDGEAAGSR